MHGHILQVMCPNKLIWFQQNPDWRDEDRIEARKVIIDRCKVKYDVGRIDRSTPYPLVRPFLGRQPVPDVDYFVHRPSMTKDSVEKTRTVSRE